MEVVVGNNEFLTIVAKSTSGDVKYPLKAPTFRQIKEYSKGSQDDGIEGLEKLLITLGLPQEVIDRLSIMDVNAISEKMTELFTKKK